MPRPPVIGIGLPEPKARKHITPELTRAAQKAGIELVILDVGAPLEQQPHVDIILHKIRTPGMDHRVWGLGGLGGAALEGVCQHTHAHLLADWETQLESYQESHPGVQIFDPPRRVCTLSNRRATLERLGDIHWAIQVCVGLRGSIDLLFVATYVSTSFSVPVGRALVCAWFLRELRWWPRAGALARLLGDSFPHATRADISRFPSPPLRRQREWSRARCPGTRCWRRALRSRRRCVG